MKKILSFFQVFLFICTIATGQELNIIDVAVTGLDGALLNNVLSRLSLVQQRDNPDLTDVLIRRLFAKAKQEVFSALEPYGYYSPVVEMNLTLEDNVWKASLHVTPGEPVRIAEIDVKLAGPGQNEPFLDEAARKFPLHVGDILEHGLYEQGKKNLTATALEAGYRDVAFSRHTVEVDIEKHSAKILLVLDTGPQYLFGPTLFKADFLSHNLLNRILPYEEGEPFSPRALIELRQSLLGSDYFGKVDVSTGTGAAGSLKVPVIITLSPKNRNKFGFGIGYGTDTGARGSAEWTNRRLNKYGHQFNLQLQPSERKSYFGGVYTIPIQDPRKERLAFLAKWEKEDFENTETELRTVSISYDHIRQAGEYSIYVSYLDEIYDTGLETGHATLLTPGIKTTWRLADDRLKTKKGVRFTLNLTGANNNIISDSSFLQASVSSKSILAFFDKWRLIGRFQLGGTIVDNIYELPPSLRFYAGGDQSVRGYAYKSIGPIDSFGNVLGGRYLVSYSVEVERKLFDTWSGALFFDSGDALNSFEDLAMNNGAGVGLRWNLPFGQVRLDVANAVSEGGGAWRIHFNVGADL